MLNEEIKTILDEISVNYNYKDFAEMTIWLDGILISEVVE